MRFVLSSWCIGLALAALACNDGNTNGQPGGCPTGQQLCNGTCVNLGACPTTPGTGGASTTTTATESGGTTSQGNGGQTAVGNGGQTVVGSGGAVGNGGQTGKGGTTGTTAATGGRPATGGAPATGGSTFVDNPNVCDDTATIDSSMSGQYSRLFISTQNPNKNYVALTNWWGKFTNQTMAVKGLGFTVTNSATTDNPANPVGYPCIFIGTYQDNASNGSNLPKQVSTITKIPTIFETNATSLDTSNFNAAYDVWFTANSTPLATTGGVRPNNPGNGGAYLMVWLYKPSNKQPRGGKQATATIEGKSWDVWIDNTNPACITYVATTPLAGLSFDLNNFIKDSITRNIVKSSMYLSIIFGGFEIWSGGNGAQVKNFCAKVN